MQENKRHVLIAVFQTAGTAETARYLQEVLALGDCFICRVGRFCGCAFVERELVVVLASCLWHIGVCDGAGFSGWVVTMVAILKSAILDPTFIFSRGRESCGTSKLLKISQENNASLGFKLTLFFCELFRSFSTFTAIDMSKRLTREERIEIVLFSVKHSNRVIAGGVNAKHLTRPPISHATVSKLLAKFCETGSVLDLPKCGSMKTVTH